MWRDFLYMQRSDRRIIVALLCIVVVALTVVWLTGGRQEGEGRENSDSIAHLRRTKTYAQPTRSVRLVPFDPNTADSTLLLDLGLQPWQVRNIYKYRSQGGIYRRKEDFARLYGLTVGQYRRLEPYIRISPDYQPASSLVGTTSVSMAMPPSASRISDRAASYRHYKLHPGETVDLNTADTALLKRVPGIGPYFAGKIVKYGERLGGYVHVSQLDEIEDFPASALPYFTIQSPVTRRLNVNQLSLQELKRHPYINYFRARAIVDYRRLHGPLRSLNDLRLSRDFPDSIITRLQPYVEF